MLTAHARFMGAREKLMPARPAGTAHAVFDTRMRRCESLPDLELSCRGGKLRGLPRKVSGEGSGDPLRRLGSRKKLQGHRTCERSRSETGSPTGFFVAAPTRNSGPRGSARLYRIKSAGPPDRHEMAAPAGRPRRLTSFASHRMDGIIHVPSGAPAAAAASPASRSSHRPSSPPGASGRHRSARTRW